MNTTTYEAYLVRANAKGIKPISEADHDEAWRKMKNFSDRLDSDDWLTPDEMAEWNNISYQVLLFDYPKEVEITFNGISLSSDYLILNWGTNDEDIFSDSSTIS